MTRRKQSKRDMIVNLVKFQYKKLNNFPIKMKIEKHLKSYDPESHLLMSNILKEIFLTQKINKGTQKLFL